MRVDVERLRRDLQDQVGPAAFVGLPFARGDMAAPDDAPFRKRLRIAKAVDLDPRDCLQE